MVRTTSNLTEDQTMFGFKRSRMNNAKKYSRLMGRSSRTMGNAANCDSLMVRSRANGWAAPNKA